jgi:hypothetical protein
MEAFGRAGPAGGHDRWIELETGVPCTGGLWIGSHPGNSVRLPGAGPAPPESSAQRRDRARRPV